MRTLTHSLTRLLPLLALLLLTTPALAQEHQHDGHMADMMEMHHAMMADDALMHAIMSDSATSAAMHAMMHHMRPGRVDMKAMHERMMAATPAERRQMMAMRHDEMKERMQAMSMEDRQEAMRLMMEVHHNMMQVPAVRAHMDAHPEMRAKMQQMMQGGMMKDGMMKDGKEHRMMKHGAEAAERTADRFREALVAGDRAAVEALLLPDALILESGGVETRDEYFGHHFERDGAFLSAVERTPLTRQAWVAGDAAWVASTSRLAGTYGDREVDARSAELLVLRRDASAPDGWRIAAVHWSSR